MKYIKVSERRTTPRAADPSIAGRIGGAAWNNQAVIDQQLQIIARNERIISRACIIIIVEAVIAVILVLAMFVIVA